MNLQEQTSGHQEELQICRCNVDPSDGVRASRVYTWPRVFMTLG